MRSFVSLFKIQSINEKLKGINIADANNSFNYTLLFHLDGYIWS